MKYYKTREEMLADVAFNTCGAEVGVQRGVFARHILNCGVKSLILVDAWIPIGGAYANDPADLDEGGHECNYQHVLNEFGRDLRVGILRMLSTSGAACMRDALLDWVYIDASHDMKSVWLDLEAWSKCLKPDGFIMGHDYRDDEVSRSMGFDVIGGVRKFIESQYQLNSFVWEIAALTQDEWPSYMLKRK